MHLHKLSEASNRKPGISFWASTKHLTDNDRGSEIQDSQLLGEVHLTELHPARHEELLEHDPVLTALPGRHAHPATPHRLGDRLVAQNVVSRGRLLDPVKLELLQLLHPVNRLPDPPLLVGVHHELPLPADGLPHDGAPPDVILHIGPHLQLEVIEPVRHELLAGNALSDWQGLDLGPT